MKLSENTLTILKNFASVNEGMVIKPGQFQRTISPADKSILVEATLEDTFPEEFGIYDLNQFLGNVTTLKNPELTFEKGNIIIDDGQLALHYRSCSPSLVVAPPDKRLVIKNPVATFELTTALQQKLFRLATMNNLTHLTVVGKDGELRLKIHERANDTSNYGTVKIGDHSGKDFVANFATSNLKLLPYDYKVEIEEGMFAKFSTADGNLCYFIALESK